VSWRLTVRAGSQVDRSEATTLDEALRAVRARLAALEPSARRGPANALFREIAPADQVAARLELRGPRRGLTARHGGVDLRGDGSLAAWTGRVSRRELAAERGEDPVAALGRALGA
jgi:hypothetical protein